MNRTIDSSTIESMMADPVLTGAIPCLADPPKSTVKTGACCGQSGHAYDYNAIKTCIALLDSKTLQLVKRRLGADKIVIHRSSTKQGRPITVKHTR